MINFKKLYVHVIHMLTYLPIFKSSLRTMYFSVVEIHFNNEILHLNPKKVRKFLTEETHKHTDAVNSPIFAPKSI